MGEKKTTKPNLERQPKLDLVIKAIEEAKKITPKGQLVKVYLPNVLKYKQFRLQELKDILTMLEDNERILTLMRFPRYLLKLDLGRYTYTNSDGEVVDPTKEYFTIKVRRRFNEWCANYWKLTHQQAGSVNWTKADVIKKFQKALAEKPNGKIPKKLWHWAKTNKLWSIIIAVITLMAAIITIWGFVSGFFS